jgi:hypothetical protein
MLQYYGIWVPHTDGRWVEGKLQKRDTLILMDMDHETIRHSLQVKLLGPREEQGALAVADLHPCLACHYLQRQANHMCLPKTQYSIQMISEWLRYATDERCITVRESTPP